MGLQPEVSLRGKLRWPSHRGGGREGFHLSSAADPSPSCLNFLSGTEFPIPNSSLQFFPEAHFYSVLHLSLSSPPPRLIHPGPVSPASLLPHLLCLKASRDTPTLGGLRRGEHPWGPEEVALGEQGSGRGEGQGTEQKMVTLPQGGVAAAINKGFSVQAW